MRCAPRLCNASAPHRRTYRGLCPRGTSSAYGFDASVFRWELPFKVGDGVPLLLWDCLKTVHQLTFPSCRSRVDPKQRTRYLEVRHYIRMTANSVSKIVMYVSEVNDAYRRENAILRTLLLEQGLSQRKISAELRKRRRKLQIRESSERTLKRVASEALDFLEKQDAAALALLEDRIEADHSKMH